MALMQTNGSDSRLIREFVLERSEAAFTELAQRHMNLVFGVAMRATGNHASAEEITQNVFIELAKKAMWLQNRDTLASWLHRAALLEARQWWRAESRRKAREDAAAILETTVKTNEEDPPVCASMLDEALLRLREKDRQAVLLRFFEGRNNREIGQALGIGEDAARKRVDKALEGMTAFFRKRGYAAGSSSITTAALVSGAHMASARLATTVMQAVMTQKGTGSAGFAALWLARFLGLNRGQLAWICSVAILVPALWQQARFLSAGEELSRLAALLASLHTQQVELDRNRSSLQLQIHQFSNDLAQAHFESRNFGEFHSNRLSSLDPRLFRWNETSSAVRLPKDALNRLSFDGKNNSWSVGSYPGDIERVIDKTGRLSLTVLEALGLSDSEQSRLRDYFASSVRNYRQFAETEAKVGGLELLTSPPPDFIVTNSDTRVWMIPALSENAANWKQQFLAGLTSQIGEERSQALMQLATRDSSLASVFEDFGANSPSILVTPLPDGVCKLTRSVPSYGHPRWFGNYTVPISSITSPAANEGRNLSEHFLGMPIPSALANYLRDWRQTHSNPPDAP